LINSKDQYFNVKSSEGGGGGISGTAFSDGYEVKLIVADSNNPPLDNVTLDIDYDIDDQINNQTETVELAFPSGVYGDTSAPPLDTRGFLISVWLSGSTSSVGQVDNPSNANGQDDSSSALLSTNALGSNTEQLDSDIGSNIGSISFTTATYRGWFVSTTPLVTGTATLIAHSSDNSFSDIVMYTVSELNGGDNYSDGSFTFDLFASGVDTLSKIQSLQIYHRTVDAVAGVTPATLNVDAGSLELNLIL